MVSEVKDIVKAVLVAFALPAMSFILSVAGNQTIDELLHATTMQEAAEKFATLNFIWIMFMISPMVVFAAAVGLRIRSRLATLVAPFLLVAGFVASLYSITYAHFLSFLKAEWREMTAFVYSMSMITAYVVAANIMFSD